jgi:alkylated DNA repair protein (DNA oxidative demethylase)
VSRSDKVVEKPEGLVYRPDFITADEEQTVLAVVRDLEFHQVRMHGQIARRTVCHFGYDYDYESRGSISQASALPAELLWLRDRCARLADLQPEELAQTLISRYPPGAPIGWHRDAPMFGAKIAGVSLLSACRMRFQRSAGDVRLGFELELAPRSAYVLGGAARSLWQHSIPPVKDLRYSITFRTMRISSRAPAADGPNKRRAAS